MTTTRRPRFGLGRTAPSAAKAAAQNARREAALARCSAAGHEVPADRLTCVPCEQTDAPTPAREAAIRARRDELALLAHLGGPEAAAARAEDLRLRAELLGLPR